MEYLFSMLKPEIIIGITGIFIACFALLATINQAFYSHKHNKLSVRPYICQNSHFIDSYGGKLTISIANKGLGTAIIKDFEIHFNNTIITSAELNSRIGKITTNDFDITSGTLSKGNALSKDEKFVLLEIKNNQELISTTQDTFFIGIIEKLRGKIHYTIKYVDIYGEQQSMTCKFE